MNPDPNKRPSIDDVLMHPRLQALLNRKIRNSLLVKENDTKDFGE